MSIPKTEMRNPESTHMDKMSSEEMSLLVIRANYDAVRACENAAGQIAKAVDAIAEAFVIPVRQLRRYNEISLTSTADPIAGEMIYIERKQPKWFGEERHHTVGEGETLTSISQLYGIRQKRLATINRLKPNATLTAGQQLRIK